MEAVGGRGEEEEERQESRPHGCGGDEGGPGGGREGSMVLVGRATAGASAPVRLGVLEKRSARQSVCVCTRHHARFERIQSALSVDDKQGSPQPSQATPKPPGDGLGQV